MRLPHPTSTSKEVCEKKLGQTISPLGSMHCASAHQIIRLTLLAFEGVATARPTMHHDHHHHHHSFVESMLSRDAIQNGDISNSFSEKTEFKNASDGVCSSIGPIPPLFPPCQAPPYPGQAHICHPQSTSSKLLIDMCQPSCQPPAKLRVWANCP